MVRAMNTPLIRAFFFFSIATLTACDGGTSFDAGTDTGSPADAMSSDVSTLDVHVDDVVTDADSGGSIDANADAGDDADADSMVDSGSTADAADTADSGTGDSGPGDTGSICPPMGTGASCDDTRHCTSGFMCDLGRCVPQGRATCGGFAMTTCHEAPYTVCLFESGHGDVGTCFSPEERDCLCDVASDQWSPCH
jgi:hypothetical protein